MMDISNVLNDCIRHDISPMVIFLKKEDYHEQQFSKQSATADDIPTKKLFTTAK